MTFQWIPNTQPDSVVLERWKTHFPKPNEAAPVPWFMGEFTYFNDLMLIHPSDLDRRSLEHFFSEVQGGIVHFPDVKQAQHLWREWYFYLLPYLALKTHKDYLLGNLITMAMLIFPDSIEEKYSSFRDDILHLIGQNIMFPQFWNEGDFSDVVRSSEYNYRMLYGESDFLGTFSPAMFFCLKYLSVGDIAGWVDSLIKISGLYWHYFLLMWLNKAIYFLSIYDEDSTDTSNITHRLEHSGLKWWSYGLKGITLPHENMVAFVSAFKKNKIFFP